MKTVYETNYVITQEQVDKQGNARLSTLLYLAQEAAGEHCALLGLDWDTMAAKELFWAVIRAKAQIRDLPRLGQRVTVKTWPMPTTRTSYPRCVTILDQEGNTLVTLVSLWVLMHTRTRAMVLPGKSGVVVEGILTGTEPELPGSLPPKETENSFNRKVTPDVLDRNGHMNNARYLDWVQELTRDTVHSFTVNYLAEALEGQEMELGYTTEGGTLRVNIHRKDGEKTTRIFAAELAL